MIIVRHFLTLQTTGQLRSNVEAGPINLSLRQAFGAIQIGIG
jgi:hypothetical protein